jgi:Biotin synthase and related enzymes
MQPSETLGLLAIFYEGASIMDKNEIIELLRIDDPQKVEELFSKARSARKKVLANKIFMYGFVYFSTFCRNNCNFCYYRKSNDIERYRKTPEEIISISRQLADSGVHLIDLTMGEDMKYHQEHFTDLFDMVKEIKRITGLPVMISPGVIDDELIEAFADLDSEWYALYQETHNRELFAKLRLNQDYDERMHAKLYAKEKGMLIEEGIMVGIGETPEDIADSLLEMGKIGAKQMRVMSFVPQKGIPMEHMEKPDPLLELKVIAIMRLLYPTALIPASLDIDGIMGLHDRIDAGANLITSIIPPKSGLMGVAQNVMDVDEGGRTVAEATVILREMGCEPATAEEYRNYINKLKCEEI